MTLTQCDQNDQLNSNRDCPNLDVVNEFKLDKFPTRTEFHLYPQNPSATMVSRPNSGDDVIVLSHVFYDLRFQFYILGNDQTN